jgi:predicted ATPase
MLLMGAHFMLGVSFFYRGELVLTRIHLEQGNAFYEPQHFRSYLSYYGYDPGVTGLSYLAMVLWLLGYLDQALQQSHEALVLAQEHGHSFNLAAALILTAVLHQYRREGQAVQERAEAAIALATDQGFSHGAVIGTILRGWALAEQGQGAEGVAQIRQGLAAYQATGTVLVHSYLLALLAEAYSTVGQCEEGVHVLAEALTLVNHRGERWWETELYRHKGELLLVQKGERMKGGPRLMPHAKTVSKAESCFHHALAIARRQKAKSLELRAALSLSRLWQQQGKRDAAHALLAESYGWFTEGFDTVDLKEAKALLDTLSSPA